MTTPERICLPDSILDSVKYPSQSADFLTLDGGKPLKVQQSYKSRDGPYNMQRKQRESYRKPFKNYQSGYRENKHQHYNRRKTLEYDFSLYFHSSMLQDPWEHLLNRYASLCASRISPTGTQRKKSDDEDHHLL